MSTCLQTRSSTAICSSEQPAVVVVQDASPANLVCVASGARTLKPSPFTWKMPNVSYTFCLNYMVILFFLCVSYLAFSVTKSAEKALDHVTENIVSNTSASLAQGLGQRLAKLFFQWFFVWSDQESLLSNHMEEVVPGVTLLW